MIPALVLPMAERLRVALADLNPDADAGAGLHELVRLGLDHLPLPGSGATLQRWRALAVVAEHDLSLAKLYEGHTDAKAILFELGQGECATPGSTWGMWAAEAPAGRAIIEPGDDGRLQLRGAKCWCSGAGKLSHGLLTAWLVDGRGPQLVRVAMDQSGVTVNSGAWQAVGMAGSASIDVVFEAANAEPAGALGGYLSRPGFWQGGAGIAACWYGGAVALGSALHRSLMRAGESERRAFRLAAHSDRRRRTGAADHGLGLTDCIYDRTCKLL